jgi:uncharacterized protein (TIGR02147 family)
MICGRAPELEVGGSGRGAWSGCAADRVPRRYYGKSTTFALRVAPGPHKLLAVNDPSVYSYSDFRRFLADWQAARQAEDAAQHKSEMSKRLGLPRTRSYFTDVLGGKRVTPVFLERFVDLLDLSRDESRFFRALVAYNQALTPEDRENAFDQLVALNRSPRTVIDPVAYRYYRHWWTGALRAVLAIEDHADDWGRLARAIRPEITPGQAREAVQLMAELGLLERRDGFWKPTTMAISSGDHARGEMVLQLQMQQMELARLAVMTEFEHPKDISTNTISISAEAFEAIRRRIASFRSEVRSIVHKDAHPVDRVYNLCLAMFPLSQKATR